MLLLLMAIRLNIEVCMAEEDRALESLLLLLLLLLLLQCVVSSRYIRIIYILSILHRQHEASRLKNFLMMEGRIPDSPIKLHMLDLNALTYESKRGGGRLELCVSLKVKTWSIRRSLPSRNRKYNRLFDILHPCV